MDTKIYALVVGILLVLYGVLALLGVFPTLLWKAIIIIIFGLWGLVSGLKGKGGIKLTGTPPAGPTTPTM